MVNHDPATATSSSAAPGANLGVKKGLPASGLPAAEEAATKLWDVARRGVVAPEAYARQFGASKASGGAWRTRIALVKGFGLVRFEGTQIGLSELGLQIINASDPPAQITARRKAILTLKSYRDLVDAFNGTVLPQTDNLATKLEFDYGKSGDLAKRAAEAFVASLRHAEMLDATNVVRKAGVATRPPVSSSQPTELITGKGVEDEDAEADEIDAAFEQEEQDEEELEPLGGGLPAQGLVSPNVSLTVTLDLSNFTADDVIRILESMGFNICG